MNTMYIHSPGFFNTSVFITGSFTDSACKTLIIVLTYHILMKSFDIKHILGCILHILYSENPMRAKKCNINFT